MFVGGPGDDTLTGGSDGNDTFFYGDLDGVTGWDVGTNHPSGGHVAQGHDTINLGTLNSDPDAKGNWFYFGQIVGNNSLAWINPYAGQIHLDLRSANEGVEQTVTDATGFSDYLSLTINGVDKFNVVIGASNASNVIYSNEAGGAVGGGHGPVHLIGGSGNDLLIADVSIVGLGVPGSDSNDTLEGMGGDDTLVGGGGNDLLLGGDGAMIL